jgi:hypothetical protein
MGAVLSRWFRFYDDAINDPKILRLSDRMRWAWVSMLCLASKNNGAIPRHDIAISLRVTPKAAEGIVAYLVEHNLLDDLGDVVSPHNWAGRQYKSDVSTERVKRFRKRNETVSETPPDTDTDTDTDTESDTEQKKEKNSLPADAGGEVVSFTGGPYAFHGKLVRLKQDQLDKWRIAFPALTDIRDEIALADEYYAEHPPNDGKWFFKVYAWLNKANKEAATKRKQHLRAIGDAW